MVEEDRGVEPESILDYPGVPSEAEAGPSSREVEAVEASGPPPPEVSPLFSTVVAERRRALEEVASRGLEDADVEPVARLLLDPEREIREMALAALGQKAHRVPATALHQALQDPTDEVRAAAVRLAAVRGPDGIPPVASLVGERRWPLTQQAALEVLPSLIRAHGLEEPDLAAILTAVAAMETAPDETESPGFAQLAAAIGPDRLMRALALPDDRRLGAARLLLEEGSEPSLRAVAALESDPQEEVRYAARSASEALGEGAIPEPPAELDEVPGEATVAAPVAAPHPAPEAEAELIAGLARVLQDPDEAVRERARTALGQVSRDRLLAWARDALSSMSAEEASLGARVAETFGLTELGTELVERAAELPPEARGPFVGALSSFSMEPAAMAGLVRTVDVTRRQEAIRLVWQVGGRPLLPHLREVLSDSSGPVRIAVLEVFGESGDPSALEVAHTVLEMDSSPAVRAKAIHVMGRAGLEQRVASLAQALSDPDPDVRATAVEILPQGMGRHAAQLLLKALSDHDERVWQGAIRHLVTLPEKDLPILWSALKQSPARQREGLITTLERTSVDRLALLALEHVDSPDYAERILAVELAGRAGTPECQRAALEALQDPAPPVRRAAATSLIGTQNPAAVPGLGRSLTDPDPEVRVEAVRALGMIDDDDVIPFLISGLKDPEPRVRAQASDALIRWSSPTVARRLAEVLSSPDLRRPAAELLARMGGAAVEPLLDVLIQGDAELRPTIGQLLSKIAGPDHFLDRLAAMDREKRLRAVEALGAIGGPRAVDGLMRALTDPDQRIRIRAVRHLGEIGDQRALEAVKRTFLGDPVSEVVAAAEEALQRLQPDPRNDAL
jgi:HEAT repeat protein